METMKRREAQERNLSTYYTGKPCTNGHMEERYTSSGACKGCIREAQQGVRRVGDRTHNTPERQAELEKLDQIKLRTYPAGADALLDTAVGLTLARFSHLTAPDVVGARQGLKPMGGTRMYLVNVHHADAPALREIETALHRQYGPDVDAIRREIFGRLSSQADATHDNGETPWRP